LEFLKRDLIEETEKNRSLRRAKEKEKDINNASEQLTTPKKNKSSNFRDGFDDDEILMISPSKFQGRRSNGGTPTKAGAKRKRKGLESPTVALEFTQDEPVPSAQPQAPLMVLDEATVERLQKPDDRLNVSLLYQIK
jgi:hypothetical protein